MSLFFKQLFGHIFYLILFYITWLIEIDYLISIKNIIFSLCILFGIVLTIIDTWQFNKLKQRRYKIIQYKENGFRPYVRLQWWLFIPFWCKLCYINEFAPSHNIQYYYSTKNEAIIAINIHKNWIKKNRFNYFRRDRTKPFKKKIFYKVSVKPTGRFCLWVVHNICLLYIKIIINQ